MAKSKKSAPSKTSKSAPKKKPSPSVKETSSKKTSKETAVYNPSTDRRALDTILARRGAVDDEHREAYGHLISDADRAALGAETKAAGVLHDAAVWAVQIDKAFTEYPAVVAAHYAPQRFQYFLDRTAALGDRLEAEKQRRGSTTGARNGAAERETLARDKRDVLIDKLKGFAGQRRTEKAAIAAAMGQTGTPDLLGRSIASLAELGRGWLALGDPRSAILARSAGLTTQVIDDAMSAAAALTDAATDAQLTGRLPATDSPEVNFLEGTVLHEMAEAERCFRNMRKQSPIIPRLVPGHATRHVIGSKRGGSSDEPEATPAPAPPA